MAQERPSSSNYVLIKRRFATAGINLIIVLASILFTVLVFEFFLQVAGPLVPAINVPSTRELERAIADPLLGIRGNPSFPDHDDRGFRNPRALEQADIIVLGDSQAYGATYLAEVPRPEIWSAVIANNLKMTEYNMSFNGWGPVQAALLLEDALKLDPSIVIFALYLGNDFNNPFCMKDRLDLLDPPINIQSFSSITASEEESTPECPGYSSVYLSSSRSISWSVSGIRRWLGWNSRVYVLFRHLYRGIFPLPDDVSRAERTFFTDTSVFKGPMWRTVFTAPYRFSRLDDRDPSIHTGVEVSKSVLLAMAKKAREAGVTFVVVLIPTKESVFAPRVTDLNEYPYFESLVATEARLRAEIHSVLQENSVPTVDPLQTLQDAEHQPYYVSVDGHPNSYGHRLIGLAISQFLQDLPME